MTDVATRASVPSRDDLLEAVPDVDRATRPALAKLTQDQLSMLREFLDGFGDRGELVRWSQTAAVATLGELEDNWYTQIVMSRSDLASLLTSDQREAWGDGDPPSPATALAYRRALAAADLIPACRQAARKLRWSAVEYVEEHDDDVPHPDHQQHPAMRPALSELEERQEWALQRLLDGFGGVDDLQAWVMATVQASYAEIDGDLSRDLYRESHTRRMLVVEPEDHEHGRFFRRSFAAKFLLPAFNRATRELSDRSGELAESENTELNINQL